MDANYTGINRHLNLSLRLADLPARARLDILADLGKDAGLWDLLIAKHPDAMADVNRLFHVLRVQAWAAEQRARHAAIDEEVQS